MPEAAKAPPSANLEIWFARGATQRVRHCEYRAADFKGDSRRERRYREGWGYMDQCFQINKTPWTEEEIEAWLKTIWSRATKRKGRR